MRFRFCPDCGAELEERELGDEGMVPWCGRCGKPWFDMFSVAVIVLVHDGEGNVLLLKQGYISDRYHNLVSGYIQPGETAEQTAVREVEEETGQRVEELELVCTSWFEKKGMLMIGFFAKVTPRPLLLSVEVDAAGWHRAGEALGLVHPFETSTSRILTQRFIEKCGK